MKKIIFSLAVAALTFGLASCNKENQPEIAGGDVEITFDINLEGIATKAVSDGTSATKLAFFAYDENDNYLPSMTPFNDGWDTFSSLKTAVKIKAVKGMTYSFVFFAQSPDGGYYTLDPATKTMTVNYDAIAKTQVEASDAFYATVSNYKVNGTFSKSVTLKRPLAQINVGTLKEDLEGAFSSGIDTLNIKAAYTLTNVYSKMNLLDGSLQGEPASLSLAADTRISDDALVVEGESYRYIAMAYVLAGEREIMDVTLDIDICDGEGTALTPLQRQIINAPFERNYRTNLIGNIFTVDGTFNVTIDKKYADDSDYYFDEELHVTTFADFKKIVNKEVAKVVLEDDISQVMRIAYGIIASDVDVIELNGHTLAIGQANYFGIYTRGTVDLTINGPGAFVSPEVAIHCGSANSVVTINGGDFTSQSSGAECIYCELGTIYITGGTFRYGDGNMNPTYLLNCKDANYTSGKANIIVTGGSFCNFDPANNAAEGANTSFVKAGYHTESSTDEEGNTWYTVVAD